MRIAAVAATLLLGTATAAQARPSSLNLRQPLGLGIVHHQPGVRAQAPSPQGLAASVQETAGVPASEVTAVNVCAAPQPGHAACAAQELVLRSNHRLVHPHVTRRETFTQVVPRHRSSAPAAAGAANPQGSMSSTPASAPDAGTPAFLQQAYDLTYLSQTAGAGDTVAVVDVGDDLNAQGDLATYRSTYGLPACTTANGCFTKVNGSGAASPLPSPAGSDWESEISLDLDAVSALCPNCHILLVEASSSSTTALDGAIASAISLGANQVSNSWSGTSSLPSGVGSFSGAAVIAATGDHGYPGAGVDNYPAAFPGVTAAGGTTLAGAAGGTSTRGYTESAWSLNSSGTGWGGGSGCDVHEPKPAYQADTGCSGRAYSDISADANPDTGLRVFDSGNGGWVIEGGTSLATPLIAAFEALTGVNGASAQWAYDDSALLNDPVSGSTGSCAGAIAYICNAGTGYDGPTGIGSVSGAIVPGAPGIGGPAIGDGTTNSYTQTVGSTTATLVGGVYPNGLDTTYHWEYGTSIAYGHQTTAQDVGSGTAPVTAQASLSGLTPGVTYHYRLVATNSDGTDYGYDYTMATPSVSTIAPVNTVGPVLSGQSVQGQTLTASTGTWSPTPTSFTYQWQRSTDSGTTWVNIAGAITSSYAVTGSDLGAQIRVVVSATNSYGTSAAGTSPVTIGSGAPAATTGPTVSGHANQGQILSATSTWNPSGASYSYQWQGSTDNGSTWTNIGSATSSTYTLAASDLGDLVRVAVTAVNGFGTTTASSAGVGPVLNNAPINSAVPTLAGTAQRTGVLTTTAGTWTGLGNTITYQWQRSADGSAWSSIAGATSSTYTAQFADEGDQVRALVTATNPSGVTSSPTTPTQIIAPFPPANTTPPTITGLAERGVILNASLGTWTGPDNVYSYQWQRDAGEGYVNIVGATAAAYTLDTADENATVRVLVTATDPDGTITQAGAATFPVTDALPVNTAAPQITGTIQRGFTIAATTGSWAGIGNSYAYQWQRSADGVSWTNISAATAPTYVVGKADEGDQLRMMVTATNPDSAASTPSAATIVVPVSPPAATTAPSFTGTAQRGAVLSAMQGIWSAVANAYTYQWQRSPDGTTWTNISGATALTYTVQTADEADFVRFTVTATNPDGTTSASSSPSNVVVSTPPVNSAVPTIIGTPARSTNVSATAGTWSGIGNTYTVQWQRSSNQTTWTSIAGATSFSYTIAVADEGFAVRALITAVNPDGTASQASVATQTISSAPPVAVVSPVITGAPLRGDTLNSTQGTWTGIGNAYSNQWQRSADNGVTWTNITGATSDSYTLTTADVGDPVRLVITAVNPDATVLAPSNVTTAVSATPPVNTAVPGIAGAPQRGLTLNSAVGTWNGIGDTFSFQWQRSADNGSSWITITGATGASYVLTTADEGDIVRILVTGANADGTSSAASPASANVASTPPVNTVPQVITGTAQRGQTLLSSAGTWLGIGNSYAYQWQHSADGGVTWTNVGGATAPTYPLGTTDESTQLRVVITASNADGSSSATSAPSATVPNAAPVNTAAPTVTGTARRGFILTATSGTWNGIGNTLAYQWQRSTNNGNTWSSIAAATSNTYTLGVGDEGAIVRIQVTVSNPDATVSASSNPTATVGGSPPSNNSLPTIRGIAQRGNTLSSTTGAWAGTGNTFTLQWQRSADNGTTWTNITGATGVSYTIQAPDESDVLRLMVTAANPDGGASAASSASATVIASPPVNTAAPVVTGTPQRTAILNATSGSWTGAGVTVAYQWQRSADSGTTWTDIAGAIRAAYTVAAGDEGDVVRVLVTATDADGSVAAGSAPTPLIQGDPPISVAAPVVLGTPSLGGTLSTDNGSWTPVGDTLALTYAWQRGDATNGYSTIAGATGATYTTVAADVGKNIRLIVTATNIDGSVSATSTATPPVQPPPVNTTAPAAPAGTYLNGFILTPDNGSWDSQATYSYSWLSCPGTAAAVTAACTSVSTKASYALTVPDIGNKIAVIVTATSLGGSTPATSALTPVIQGQPLTQLTPPSISGNPQPPNTLFANPGSWTVNPTAVDYDWDRCDPDGVSNCTLVAADTAHYSLTSADDGHALVLIANVSSPGRVATGQSAPLVVQDQPLPQATVLPTVSGTTQRTFVMGATGGVWTNSPTGLSYQWERCNASGHNCLAIPGATRPTYQLTNVDEGSTITVAVSATNTSGTTTAVAVPSGVVTAMPPVATGRPALSTQGVQQSVPVTVTNGTWQATGPSTYTTVWQRCNSAGASCAAISGATQSSYTPAAADVGHTLVVIVTATNVDGSVASTSSPSDVVLPAAPRWRDLPVLSANDGYVGGVLSVTDGVFTGPAVATDVTQVMRCTNACAPITSAASYTIANADIGAILRVRETAANAGGTVVVWSAQYVGPVASSASASAVLGVGQAVLRNRDGVPLATVQLSTSAAESAAALFAHATAARRSGAVTRVITVRRAAKVRGPLRAWVCTAAGARGSAPSPCSRQVTIRGASAKLKLPRNLTGRVRVVVVRRGH
ncbi:MAG TPA: hypothetical protein VGG07_11860 [Solirubrobacteraceae bacterium]